MRWLLVGLIAVLSAHAADYYVIVAGLGGAQEYDSQFDQWSKELETCLRQGAPATITRLSGGGATRQQVRAALRQAAGETSPTDAFVLLLIGHGTFDGEEYKLNLPGPDMTARELASLLNALPTRRQLVVNMTSASGASLKTLAHPNRVVITATKSGTERNVTRFPRYWLDALRDPAADTDKNGSVSALEAFRYAQRKTAAYFEQQKLLATEHAMLDDTGTGEGSRDPDESKGQGRRAAMFAVTHPASATVAAVHPGKRLLVAKKQDLEAKIDQLKYDKAALPEDEYRRRLSALLIDLARTQAEIDRP